MKFIVALVLCFSASTAVAQDKDCPSCVESTFKKVKEVSRTVVRKSCCVAKKRTRKVCVSVSRKKKCCPLFSRKFEFKLSVKRCCK